MVLVDHLFGEFACMPAYFASTFLKENSSAPTIIVKQHGNSRIARAGSQSVELAIGFPKVPQVFNARSVEVVQQLDQKDRARGRYQVLESFIAKALARAIIISNNCKRNLLD
jgi:hypothetical protein